MSDTKRTYRRRNPLSTQQQLEVIELYTTTEQPIAKIAEIFDVTQTYPYRVLERWQIDWRRGQLPPFDFQAWLHAQQQQVPAGAVLEPHVPAAMRDPAEIKTFEVEASQKWVIEITESFEVESWDIDEALAQAHQLRPGARVTSVRVRP